MLAEADTRRRFPASGNIGAELPQGTPYHGWGVNLLPWIDQAQIHTQWDFNTAFNAAPNQGLARTSISVLTCPSDISVLGGTGDLSYVVNGGFGWTAPVDCPEFTHPADPSGPFMGSFDLNGNGIVCTPPDQPDGDPSDRDLFKQTGLFFAENWPHGSGTVRYHAPGGIHDGSSQTLLIAENVRAGADPANADANWANPYPWRTCFFVSAYVCQDAVCTDGNVDYARANDHTNVPYRFESINAGLTQPEGEAPWPSSFHVGGVHVAYADGHVVFLSENIDGVVYAALVSPQGARIEGPLAQPVINTTGF
jgi:prepilin-type processing-associated H-X9-DG protein